MDIAKEIIREIPKGLLKWYDFCKDSRALYIGSEEDELAEMLKDASLQTECMTAEETMESGWQESHLEKYDYIVAVEKLEEQSDPIKCLSVWKGLLRQGGRLFLGMNNRYGLRYFCGDRDPYTNCNFDGIENYRRFGSGESLPGRCYNRSEIRDMLQKAGWPYMKMHSVMPDLRHPQLIYAEDFLPNEELSSRLFPAYHSIETMFLEEECLYTDLAKNGMFHLMANTYLIECSLDGTFSDVRHVTLSLERGRELGLMTIVRENDTVEKRAVYPEGEEHLRSLVENLTDLKHHGIATVDARMDERSLVMPFIKGKAAQVYLRELIYSDRDEFIRQMDRFRELILRSSEIVQEDKGDGKGAVLRKGYMDLVPLNSFYVDGEYIFYDQEFYLENCPANVIITRMVRSFYYGNTEMGKILPSSFFFERYGLQAEFKLWVDTETKWFEDLRKKELVPYHQKNRRDQRMLLLNRRRMNFSAEDYQRHIVDIFHNADTRKLILFGAGKNTRKFVALYHKEFSIYGIIDNNESKWGQQFEGITIYSPELLKDLQIGEYKVIVCVNNFWPVISQLERMGVTEYGIFDPEMDYPRERLKKAPAEADNSQKRFHVGYVAGVFDMFHIGHLNLLKRAKEQCDYLIVGVVTDDRTERIKRGRKPVIPFEERLEIVRSCRYVDEAVEIPTYDGETRDAFAMYHFDCQFSGNDHVNDPHWIAEKKFLEEHGSELIFFPYTEGTSSTMLREILQGKLQDQNEAQ